MTPQPAGPVAAGARSRLALPACFATMFMLGISISILGPSLPAIAERTAVTLPQAGLLFTLFSAGSVSTTLLVARLNDRPIRHALLVVGALFLAAGCWLVASATTFGQVGIAAALCGMAMSGIGTAPNAIFSDLFRGRAGSALNALHLSPALGAVVGPALTGLALRSGQDYRAVFRLAAAAAVALAIVWVFSRPPRPAAVSHSAGLSLSFALASPLALVLLLALLYTGTEQVISGWIFTFARDAVRLPAAVASLCASLLWLAVLLGRLAAVGVLRRVSSSRLLAFCAALAVVAVGLIIAGRNMPVLVWVGVACAGFAFGPVFPTALALSGELLPGRAGAASSLVVAAGSIGAMTLPWAAGRLIPAIGITGTIASAWIPLAAMMVCVWAVARVQARPVNP